MNFKTSIVLAIFLIILFSLPALAGSKRESDRIQTGISFKKQMPLTDSNDEYNYWGNRFGYWEYKVNLSYSPNNPGESSLQIAVTPASSVNVYKEAWVYEESFSLNFESEKVFKVEEGYEASGKLLLIKKEEWLSTGYDYYEDVPEPVILNRNFVVSFKFNKIDVENASGDVHVNCELRFEKISIDRMLKQNEIDLSSYAGILNDKNNPLSNATIIRFGFSLEKPRNQRNWKQKN